MNLPVIYSKYSNLPDNEAAVAAMKTAILQLFPGSTEETYRFVYYVGEEGRAEGLADIVLTLEEHAKNTLHELAELGDKVRAGETTLGEDALWQLDQEVQQGKALPALYLQAYNQGLEDYQAINGRV